MKTEVNKSELLVNGDHALFGVVPLILLQAGYTSQVITVYATLSSFQGKAQSCFPSLVQISKRAGIRYEAASRAIAFLQSNGWINVHRRRRNSNIYIVHKQQGLWAMVPIMLLQSKVRRSDILVYAALAIYQANKGSCFPSRKELAERTCINNLSTISKSVSRLKASGWLQSIQRGCSANLYICAKTTSQWPESQDKITSQWPESQDKITSQWPESQDKTTSQWPESQDKITSQWPESQDKTTSQWPESQDKTASQWPESQDKTASQWPESQTHSVPNCNSSNKTSIKTSSSKSSVQYSTLGTHSGQNRKTRLFHSGQNCNSRNITNKGESKQPTLIGQASVKTKTMNNQQINDNLKTLLHNNVFPILHRQIEKGFIREQNGRFIFNNDLSEPIKTILQAYLKHKAYFIKQNNHQKICEDKSPIDHLNKHVIPKLSPYGRKELEKVKFSAKGNKLHVNISQIRPHHLILLRKSFGQNLIEDRKSAI